MATQYTSSPYTRTHEPEIITQLRIEGYDVKEKNNKYYVNGIEIDKNEPLFEAVKRIKLAEIKEQNKGFAKFYHERYNKITADIKEAKKRDQDYTNLFKLYVEKINTILSWNKVKTIDDISDIAQRKQAEEFEYDKNNFKAMHIRESNNVYSLAMEGTSAALSAAKFEFFV